MIPYTDQFPSVVVVVPSSTLARFLAFELSLEGLLVSSGTHLSRAISANIALNCNEPVRLYPEAAAFWFIDDDHQFDQYTLLRLMAHEKPVVVPITCLKDPPFWPCIYEADVPDGEFVHHEDLSEELRKLRAFGDETVDGLEEAMARLRRLIERGPLVKQRRKVLPYSWAKLDKVTGLLPVQSCGRSGMLVRREVFQRIPGPWFQLGQTNPEYSGEDLHFCGKLREAGIPILADTDLSFGHTGPVTAWPVREADGSWRIRLVWANGQIITIHRPDVAPTQVPARTQKGNLVAERMAALVAGGMRDEQQAFQQAVAEIEAAEGT